MPTVGVRNDPGGVRGLPVDLDPSLDGVSFAPLGGGESLTWTEAFDANSIDGVTVLHRGRVGEEQVVPPAAVDGTERGGDRAKFAAAGL